MDFKDKFKRIKDLLLELDPNGYVDMGAPDDEYDDIVFRLLSSENDHTVNYIKSIFPNLDDQIIKKIYEKINIDNNYCCCCGVDYGYNPHIDSDGYPDNSICEYCGVEHGYEDLSEEVLYNYRIEWIKKGFLKINETIPLFSSDIKVDDWNLVKQLKNIGIDFKDPKILMEYKKLIPNIEAIIKPYLN